MLMPDIHSVILRNDTYMVYTLSGNPAGIASLETSNFQVYTVNAFWRHRIDGHEPLVEQAFALFAYHGYAFDAELLADNVDALMHYLCDTCFWSVNRLI